MKSSKPLKTRKILLTILYVFAWILVLEICVTFIAPAPRFERITTSDGEGSRYELSANRKLIYAPKPGTGDFNKGGYRGKSHEFKQNNNSTRVLIMGDSVAEGLGVSAEERFTDILQNRLGASVEIINLSVRGYNLLQEAEYLRAVGLQYHPQEVIFAIAYNDMQLHSAEIMDMCNRMDKSKSRPAYRTYYAARSSLESLLLRSNIYRHIRYRLLDNTSMFDSIGYMMTINQTEETIKALKILSQEQGFHLSFMFLPYNSNIHLQMKVILNSVERHGISYLDLNTYMRSTMGEDRVKELFINNDPCHLTPKGHSQVAEVIEENIEQLLESGLK